MAARAEGPGHISVFLALTGTEYLGARARMIPPSNKVKTTRIGNDDCRKRHFGS